MALTERVRPYMTMILHNEDGSIGAHHVQISEFLREDGSLAGANQGAAIPISVASGQSGLALTEVLGEATTAALIHVEQLTERAAALEQKNESLTDQLQRALAEIDRLSVPVVEPIAEPTPEQL